MLRRLLGMALVLGALAGCTKLGRECQDAAQCGEGEVCQAGYCFAKGQKPSEPVEPDKCEPGCTATQTCTVDGCRASFTGLTLLSPSASPVLTGGPVTVRAQLTRQYDVAAYPSTLSLSVTPVGGTEIPLAPVTSNGDGTYSAEWTPPAGEADFDVKAVYAEAGLTAPTVRVRVDTVGPTFTVGVQPAVTTPSPAAPGFTYVQPGAPEAFRRSETVVLRVQSTATDVDPATLRVTVRGRNASPDLTNLAFTECAGAPFCRQANVNLWEPGFNAFNGTLAVEVVGDDLAGNAGGGTGSIPVTRWKWAFNGEAGDILASPAIGTRGTVYFGTSGGFGGKVFALNPEGTRRWAAGVTVGDVKGSPALGKPSGSAEYVYVAGSKVTATTLYALQGTDGVITHQCDFLATQQVTSAAAVMDTPLASGTTETGLFAPQGYGSVVGIRPEAKDCPISVGSRNAPNPAANGSLLTEDDGSYYYPTNTSRMVRYQPFFSPSQVWNANPSQSIYGMAILGTTVLGSGGNVFNQGGLFSVSRTASGQVSQVNALPGTAAGRIYQFVANADGTTLFYGREFESPPASGDAATELTRYNFAGLAVSKTAPNVGVLQAAPVLGSDGRLYTVNTTGELSAWDSELARQWSLPGLGANVQASPTLDCARMNDGTQQAGLPGVLYVAGGTTLHAFIVDSPRMPTAGWPKYQHDARNSGNPATPITSCQ